MMIRDKQFTIGADPEIFVGKGGIPMSAFGLIEGDKANPTKVEKGAVQVDGMALEFNIDPATSFEEFQTNLAAVQTQLQNMVPDYEFLQQVSVEFEQKLMDSQPSVAVELGCSPDFDAYDNGMPNPPPEATGNMRTVGGHVHIGGFPSSQPFHMRHMALCARLTRFLDEEVGVYSILWDKDDKRRALYGKAGAFRPKPYGMEYRVLSNSWIWHPRRVSFVYRGVQRALEKMFDPNYVPHGDIQYIINHSKREHEFFKDNALAKDARELGEQ